MLPASHPILTCEAAREFETRWFAGDEAKEWIAMQRAGHAIADAVLQDFRELGGFPPNGSVLVLVGKGHNGGDALIAAHALLEKFPSASVTVHFAFGERTLRPLAARAWRDLVQAAAPQRVHRSAAESLERPAGYDLCLDGVVGFQFRPPLPPEVAALFRKLNLLPIRLRAAVDLPSGLNGDDAFRADFTYATGIVKSPALATGHSGRIRYLDLGFFPQLDSAPDRVLTFEILAPLNALRPPQSDKRTYGHVFVIGGSRGYPGAILMTVLAALRSGVGLVTAFVPESLVPAYAARAPEAMWVGWPETPDGGLALEGQHLLRPRLARASALVLGPGLGREPETLALAADIAAASTIPLVIDADALQPDIVRAGDAPRVLTPHAGELARIAGGAQLGEFAQSSGAVVVLKGAVTRIVGSDGGTYHSLFGGPVLARGGSGDLLAGLVGGLLAQLPRDPLLAAARAVVWHGAAADALARARGQVAVSVTELLDYLSVALRGDMEKVDRR